MADEHRIEVVVYRDPDGDTDVYVFRNGVMVPGADVTVVDPGKGHSAEDWDATYLAAARTASAEADTALCEFFAAGHDTGFIREPAA